MYYILESRTTIIADIERDNQIYIMELVLIKVLREINIDCLSC